ncbi:hypothetical protein AMTRI_Chr04g245730 [Amborella trichopoda]
MCKPISTPIDKKTKLSNKMCPIEDIDIRAMEKVPYRSTIGSLMYAMTGTRPDLSFFISLVSRFQSNLEDEHWKAVKRILRYLKGTMNNTLTYKGETKIAIERYSDASYRADPDDAKSTSGYVFMLGGGAVYWKSKKQDIVALSTMESEYVACCQAAKEVVWIKKFFNQLNFYPVRCEAMQVFCDNTAVICVSKEPRFHKNSKHIKPYFFHLRNEVRLKEIVISYISTNLIIADTLTKRVVPNVFVRHMREMVMRESEEERM